MVESTDQQSSMPTSTSSPARLPVFAVYYSTPKRGDSGDPGTSRDGDDGEEGGFVLHKYDSLTKAVQFAASPVPKSCGARFRRFSNDFEVEQFERERREAEGKGDSDDGNAARPTKDVSERSSPFKSVPLKEFNAFRLALEKGNLEYVTMCVNENPRYLVNTDADCASIVHNGCRYNALHILAKSGHAHIVHQILEWIKSLDWLCRLYGCTEKIAEGRRQMILQSYLNTPDKGRGETPLHVAAQFGHVEIVRLLVNESICRRDLINKFEQSALAQAGGRCQAADDLQQRIAAIRALIGGHYVVLWRDENRAPVLEVEIDNQSDEINSHHEYGRVAARAGPFPDESTARDFLKSWKCADNTDVRRSDPRKGAERIGRRLAVDANVPFLELWPFAADNLIDISTSQGLQLLENHLREVADARKQLVVPGSPDMSGLCDVLENLAISDSRRGNETDENVYDEEDRYFTAPQSPGDVFPLKDQERRPNDSMPLFAYCADEPCKEDVDILRAIVDRRRAPRSASLAATSSPNGLTGPDGKALVDPHDFPLVGQFISSVQKYVDEFKDERSLTSLLSPKRNRVLSDYIPSPQTTPRNTRPAVSRVRQQI